MCAECNSTLCNTKEFFKKQMFCLIKTANSSITTKETRVCNKEKCFVERDRTTGILIQDCGNGTCSKTTIDCAICNETNYCTEENKVYKHCWKDIKKGEICKNDFSKPCYIWRNSLNEVKRGCGSCPFFTCEECKGNRCNNEEKPPYYCFGFKANYKKCKESYCYIAKIEDTIKEQFKYDCGKCPTGVLDFYEENTKINMSNVQCVDCNNKPACNSDSFFNSKLFCWEKSVNNWLATKGKRICQKGICFIGLDKNDTVQGCGNCSEYKNLTKCNECSSPLCNDETKLPQPRMCYYLNAYFKTSKVMNKTCHHLIENCYIAIDVFMRVEQNCGNCPPNYKNCKTCNETNFCNNSTLIPIPTTKTSIVIPTSTSTITTTIATSKKQTTIMKNTTINVFTTKKSSANVNKLKIELLIMFIVWKIIYCVLQDVDFIFY